MKDIVEGTAWVFGDSVDTDSMYPGYAMKLPIEDAAKHVFYDLRPDWVDRVREGDVLIAGRNFGIGSSRPVAQLLLHIGIRVLVAEEFNSLFLRNAINFGLPALTIPGIAELVSDGDAVRVDVRAAAVEVTGSGRLASGSPLPAFVLDIVEQGGLFNKLVAEGYIDS